MQDPNIDTSGKIQTYHFNDGCQNIYLHFKHMGAFVMIDKLALSFIIDSKRPDLNTQINDNIKWLEIDTSSLFPDL